MTALPKRRFFSPEEYLALEDVCEYRSEYESGEIVAMAGGTLNHVQITSNISRFIGNRISENCAALPAEIKVWIEKLDKFYYPDVTVLCEEPEFYQNRTDAIVNPILIAEVLSDSTEAKDRGKKFFAYRTLESFQEYILVSQRNPVIEQFVKQSDGSWKFLATIGLDSVIRLETVNVGLTLREIYHRISFEETENL